MVVVVAPGTRIPCFYCAAVLQLLMPVQLMLLLLLSIMLAVEPLVLPSCSF
jgi:hypothetical protein